MSAGYKRLPASDPKEEVLREAWHTTRRAKEAGEAGASLSHSLVEARLIRYLWDTAAGKVAADRAKHPKAKRNQTHDGIAGTGRNLP